MIGHLRGKLVFSRPPWLLLEVGGVGYELQVPLSAFHDLPAVGQEVTLLTHYMMKEDSVALYGFVHESERVVFRKLQKVSGVGAKIALAVLSSVSVQHFVQWVNAADVTALTRIPGIGKKTAERVIVELRDHIANLGTTGAPGESLAQHATPGPLDEAIAALQQLGYKPAEASRWIHAVAMSGDSTQTIIRKALSAALGR